MLKQTHWNNSSCFFQILWTIGLFLTLFNNFVELPINIGQNMWLGAKKTTSFFSQK
jgi:hypothetical protein